MHARIPVMRLVQYCTARLVHQPESVDDMEMFARRTLLTDVYGFFASGSKLYNQQTLKENRIAYTR